MSKEQLIDVELEEGDEKTTVKIMVKKPTNAVMTAAQRKGALIWTQCIQEGVMTKKELEKILEARGIWSKAKDKEQTDILDAISTMEKKLYLGSRGQKLKTSDGKKIAIDMRRKRIELRDLLAEKISLEQNTAESLSDNAKFDYIVANCTFDVHEQPIYANMDDYSNRSDDPIAFAAAQALAQMMYALDKDFEDKLPENKFLKKFEYVNTDLHLVDKDGHTVDVDGRLVNEEGFFINDDGKRTDKDGNLLDEDGLYVPTNEYEVDDRPKKKRASKKKAAPKAAVAEAEESVEPAEPAEPEVTEDETPEDTLD
jgi:hypothetical protein